MKPGPRADLAFDPALCPRFFAAEIFGTDFQRVVFHRLDNFKALFALGAFVLVGGHSSQLSKSYACIQQRLLP
jgi:hypothetical protein